MSLAVALSWLGCSASPSVSALQRPSLALCDPWLREGDIEGASITRCDARSLSLTVSSPLEEALTSATRALLREGFEEERMTRSGRTASAIFARGEERLALSVAEISPQTIIVFARLSL